MNTGIVMLGSNTNPEENLSLAKNKIMNSYQIIDQSQLMETKAIGKKYNSNFLNQAIKILSDDNAKETILRFKEIEEELGRTEENKKQGIVPVDIDLIFWNDYQLHEDYNQYPFVRKCIDEIKDKLSITEST